MANAMAQAIGAQAAFPKRQVISLSGDGGFTMLMGDFLSLAQLGLPVKVVVFNNGSLGFIELEQKSTGFLDFGTELKNPNLAAMAEAVGIHGIRLEDAADVEPGIAAALAHEGPVLVDAVVNRQELSMPPTITLEMAKGFTLYMVKAVMSGRGDEVLDLAVTNLWRESEQRIAMPFETGLARIVRPLIRLRVPASRGPRQPNAILRGERSRLR